MGKGGEEVHRRPPVKKEVGVGGQIPPLKGALAHAQMGLHSMTLSGP